MNKIKSDTLLSWIQSVKDLEQNGLPKELLSKLKETKLNQLKFEVSFIDKDLQKNSGISQAKFEKIKKIQSIDDVTLYGFFESKGSIKNIKI